MVKSLPLQETRKMCVPSLGWEDHLEEEIATRSSFLSWKIPQRSLVGYSLWGGKESGASEYAQDIKYSSLCYIESLCW